MRILSLAWLAVISLSGFTQAEPTTLRIASGEYAPFTGEALPDGGTVNRYVAAITVAAGYDIEYHYMPWKRAMEATRRGKYHASSYWAYSAARESDFIQVGPVQQDPIIFLVRLEAQIEEWNDLTDLANYRIGVVPGYTYTQELWDMGADGTLTLSDAPSDEANLRKLLSGRIDMFPITRDTSAHMLQTLFSAEERTMVRALEKPLSTVGGFLLVSRKAPGADEIAARLQHVIDNGQVPLTH